MPPSPLSFTDAELRTAFDAIDTDQSGDIDLSELTVALKAINPDADEETLAKMIAIGDVDGDKEVSFYEFKKLITKPLERADYAMKTL